MNPQHKFNNAMKFQMMACHVGFCGTRVTGPRDFVKNVLRMYWIHQPSASCASGLAGQPGGDHSFDRLDLL